MKKIFAITGMALALAACDSMDSNYIDYLHNIKVYSPAVIHLTHIDSYRTVELMWQNPAGDVAQKIKIEWNIGEKDTAVIIPEMVDYYKIENMEVRGYDIAVYTIDKYDNLSVPARVNAFPSGNVEIEVTE
ncbi:MAG: DUF4998 domain-containing protein [Dysgonamonadaceae bacterium]|jgi:hypothetical protein|nr:DUF4998 domain-containing protein [Dysgonamonadaceae bacterium]